MAKINCKLSTLLKARSEVAGMIENRMKELDERVEYLNSRTDERKSEIIAGNPEAIAKELDDLFKDDWRIQSNNEEVALSKVKKQVLEDLLSSI